MKIKLDSNRDSIIKPIIPFVIVCFLCAILISVTIIIENDEDLLPELFAFDGFTVVFVIAAITIKLYKGMNYEFTENKIISYKRKKQVGVIDVSDIEVIVFYRFKWRYLISIFWGELPTGGCWSLHICKKDGTKTVLRFFQTKDVELLKEKLYGGLLTIV